MSRSHGGLAALALALGVLVLYGRVLGFPFVYDDVALIATNAALADPSTLGEALGHDLFHFAEGVRPSPYWRPTVTLSYYLDHWVGGGDPGWFHATNLLALWAAGLGLGGLLWRATGRAGLSVVLVALFLVHPLQVEGAANAAGRTDLLCAALGLWALQVRRPLVSAGLVFAACGAKEIGVVLPLAAWLLDRHDTRVRWQAAAVVLFLGLRGAVLQGLELLPGDLGGPTAASLIGAGTRVCFWIGRLLWPTPMGPAADLAPAGGALALAGWGVIVLLVAASVRVNATQRAGLALLLVPLLLVSGVAQASPRYGDTLSVLPLAGVLLVFGVALAETASRPLSDSRGLAALAVLASVLAWLSAARIPDWESSEALWEAAHTRAPADRVVTLGVARDRLERDPQGALDVLDPSAWAPDTRQRREAAAVMARAHLALGQEDEAMPWLAEAVADDPEATWSNGTACVLLAARGSRAAASVCELAVRDLEHDPDVLNAMGISLIRTGGPAAALPWFQRAAAAAPDRPELSANRDRAAAALSAP